MKMISPRTRSFRSWKVAEGRSKEATERLRKLESLEQLRAEGCRPDTTRSVIGWSRATCHRWRKRYRQRGGRGRESKSRRPHRVSTARWTPADEAAVRRMREKSPFFGKRRLRVMLERDGRHRSASPIGRSRKKRVNRNRVKPCRFCRGRVKPRQRRDFRTGHAKRFREAVIEDLPSPLQSIQVDGGSECRAGFEDAGEALGIPRFVRPPKSPRLNGVVERANDRSRVEFWSPYCSEFKVREAQARAGRLSALLQLHEAALCPGNDDPDGVPSAMRITETLSLIGGEPAQGVALCGCMRIKFRS